MNEQPIVTKSNIAGYIISGIIIVLLIVITVQYFQKRSLQKKYDIASVELMASNDSVTAYKTKAGDDYFKFNSVTIERNALRGSLIADSIEIKALRAMNVNYRDIVSVLKVKLEASGHIITDVRDSINNVPHDSIDNTPFGSPNNIIQTIKWNNKHLFLNASIKNKIFDADYLYKANLLLVPEKVGKSIVVTGKFDDPNAKIITGSQITIAPQTYFYHKWYIYMLTGLAGFVGGIYLAK